MDKTHFHPRINRNVKGNFILTQKELSRQQAARAHGNREREEARKSAWLARDPLYRLGWSIQLAATYEIYRAYQSELNRGGLAIANLVFGLHFEAPHVWPL